MIIHGEWERLQYFPDTYICRYKDMVLVWKPDKIMLVDILEDDEIRLILPLTGVRDVQGDTHTQEG